MSLRDQVEDEFRHRFGEAPAFLVRAPGRVNLIGEHTDYNDGFVLPMAIDRAIWIALRPADGRRVVVHSLDFGGTAEFSTGRPAQHQRGLVGIPQGCRLGAADGRLPLAGWEGVLAGDVPIGAGLSSSAALEMATARAFAAVSGLAWEPAAMALLGQRAENQWVGVNCGIMDQMISACGRADHALLIDCRSLGHAGGAAAARNVRGRVGHGHPARAGRFGLQRAARPVRGGRAFLRRAGAARCESAGSSRRGGTNWTRRRGAAPATW